MATITEINEFMKQYDDVKYSLNKKEINNIFTSSEKYGDFLLEKFNLWERKSKALNLYSQKLNLDEIHSRDKYPEFDNILNELKELVDALDELQKKIGPVTFEEVQNELIEKVRKTIGFYRSLFELATGFLPYSDKFAKSALSNLKLQITLDQIGNKNLQIDITQARNKVLPDKRVYTYTKQTGFISKLSDFGNHFWILSRLLFLIILYWFVQTDFAHLIQTTYSWVKIPIWILMVIWIIRSIVKSKFSIIISGLIIWGPILLWLYDIVIPNPIDTNSVQLFSKLFLWVITLIWFPIQFLNYSKDKKIDKFIILLIIWAGTLALFSYGIIKGFLIITLLLTIPINRLLHSKKSEQHSLSTVLDKRLYIPTAIFFIIVGLFITGELFWVNGALIWIMFAITSGHSFKYFRKSYDLIEELYPDPDGKRRRHLLLLLSLVISIALLFPGFLGKLQYDFVMNLYIQASGLAFGLITILLAVQAIIPGITTWSSDTSKSNRLREMRSILRANAGLEGFMQWFFILFIYSIFVWFFSSKFLASYNTVVDLTVNSLIDQKVEIINIISQIFSQNVVNWQIFYIRISTIFFGIFIYVAIYGIAQLYYLFVAANTLTLPIRDSIYSNEVEIESIKLINYSNDREKINKKNDDIQKSLKNNPALNGQIISNMKVIFPRTDNKKIEVINIEVELDFVELNQLINILKPIYSSMFELGEVKQVNLSIIRRTFQKFRIQPVFSLQIDKDEWEFIRKDIKGFPLDYKLRCLNARISNYVLAESQIA